MYPFRLRGKLMLCVFCGEEYAEPAAYRRHMNEMHKSFTMSTAFAHCGRGKEWLKVDCTDLRCKLCNASADTLEEIAAHLNDNHPNRNLDVNHDIALHPYRMDTDRWHCYICPMKFPSITRLSRHTTSHYLKFTCESCGRKYLSNDALKCHIRSFHAANPICRKCKMEFSSLEERKEHMRTSKLCWTFRCMECGERFMSWEYKQKHLEEAHGKQKATYTCPECGEAFKERKSCYTHFKMNHTDDSFVCTCCGRKFAFWRDLENHRVIHTGEKKFECDVCKKCFNAKKSLAQHMWIHSENKRFSCTICKKQFVQKVSLKYHMKAAHPDVTEY